MIVAKKVVADLWHARGRASLVVLAIATGLFAVVCVASTNAVLTRELRNGFDAITPASATIRSRNISGATLDSIAAIPGIRVVDGARTLSARAAVGHQHRPIILSTVADFEHARVNKVEPESGQWPPRDGAILLERSAVRVAKKDSGQAIAIQIGSDTLVSLAVTGTVHDFSQAPAWQEGMIYGYVSRGTMQMLTGDSTLNDVRIVVSDSAMSVSHIRTTAQHVAAFLEHNGHHVREIRIPPPGEHPHQGQMNSLLGIQQAFGAVALLLSGSLIVVLLTALLAQHRKQIGIMKSIGARMSAIGGMYVLWIVMLAACAQIVAIPSGIAAGREYARFIAGMLNFDIRNAGVPASLLVALIAVGCVLPLVFAVSPIIRAARMTTRAALSDQVPIVFSRAVAPTWRVFQTQAGRFASFGLANSVRIKGRFALVVATIAVGGALFLAALNLGRSFSETLAVSFARFGFDIALDVNGDVPLIPLDSSLRTIAGIANVNVAVRMRATMPGVPQRMLPGATMHGAHADDGVTVSGSHATTLPHNVEIIAGHWLVTSDSHGVVANHAWTLSHPQYHVGDSITLVFGTDSTRWQLVGIVREVFTGAQLIARNDALEPIAFSHAHSTAVQITTTAHDNTSLSHVMSDIDRTLAEQGITIRHLEGLQDMREARENHVLVIVSFLVAVAGLGLVVGGLGLATMLSVAIFERSHEIGVMRAIGATRTHLLVMMVVEGGWIAFAGWLGGVVLSVPASYALDNAFGQMMLGTPLDFHASPTAIPTLAIVTACIAFLASILPAWRASALNTRDLLTSN